MRQSLFAPAPALVDLARWFQRRRELGGVTLIRDGAAIHVDLAPGPGAVIVLGVARDLVEVRVRGWFSDALDVAEALGVVLVESWRAVGHEWHVLAYWPEGEDAA